MGYLGVFGVLTEVGVDVSTFFGVGAGAGVVKRGTGVKPEKCHSAHLWLRDEHYPVCQFDIRQDSEFATGYRYPKTAFKRDRSGYIQGYPKRFSQCFEDSDSWKKLHNAQTFIALSEAFF